MACSQFGARVLAMTKVTYTIALLKITMSQVVYKYFVLKLKQTLINKALCVNSLSLRDVGKANVFRNPWANLIKNHKVVLRILYV